MKAVVLVGGQGTRLRPLTDAVPKPLLPIANVPFIERLLGRLANIGCEEAVLSSHYKPDAFDEFLRSVPLPVRLAVEDVPLGTGGAIKFAAQDIKSTFLVLNGDILTDLDLLSLIDFHLASGVEATLALTPVDDPSRFGVVETDEMGMVLGFIEKPPPGTASTNLVNAGTYVCEPGMLDRIPAGEPVSVEREVFPHMALDEVLAARASHAYWADFGTHESYLQVNLDCLSGRLRVAIPGAVSSDRVFVERNAVVAPSAVLGPNVVVGAGAVVGEGAVIGPGVAIGNRARVGADVRLSECVVLDDACIAPGAKLHRVAVARDATVSSDLLAISDTAVGSDLVL